MDRKTGNKSEEAQLSPKNTDTKKSKEGTPQKKISMEEADKLKKLIKENQLEIKEQNLENRQQFQQLTKLIQEMSINQGKRADEAKQDLGLVIQKQETMEKRVDILETGGAAKVEHTFIGQHKLLIDKARYGRPQNKT